MIREEELLAAIAECQGERNPNANTCIKLAAYYIILDHISSEPTDSARGYSYSSGSEFSRIAERMEWERFMGIMEELMEALEVLCPKLYRATLDKMKL